MTISKAEAHSRAVVSIQTLLSKHRPGTNSHRIAELALDLAFNGSSPSNGDFKSELLADARLLIRKQVAARLRSSLSSAPRSRKFPAFAAYPLSMRQCASHLSSTTSSNVVEAVLSATGARNVRRG
jgi:hypothetical protein